jgi:hypothetical protein
MAQTAFRRRPPVAAPLLLALMLGVGLVLPTATRGGAVADEATPAPTPTPGPKAGREGVLSAAFDALPPAPAVVTLTRLSFPAGSRAAGDGPAGPRFVVVETQAIVVVVAAGDRPRLSRAPGSPERTDPAADPTLTGPGGEIRLGVGDGLVLGLAPVELRNEGARPASVLIAAATPLTTEANGLLPVPVQGRVVEPDTVTGVPVTGGTVAESLPGGPFLTAEEVLVEPLAGGVVAALPSGPGEFRLDRLRIAAGWHTPLPVQPGPWLLLVESGTLGLAAQGGTVYYRGAAAPNPTSVPGRAKTVAPGAEVILTAGGMSFVHPDAVVELRNRGRTTLSLLALTVWPARAEDA